MIKTDFPQVVTKQQVTTALGYTPAGGENLILDSGVEITNSNYAIHEYKLSEPFELNTTYTMTIWGELGEDKTGFAPFIGNGNNSLSGKLIKKSDRVYSGTVYRYGQWLDTADRTKLLIYVVPNTTGVNSVIRKIKLERGTVNNPVWTPAPEDVVVRSELEVKTITRRFIPLGGSVQVELGPLKPGIYLLVYGQFGEWKDYGLMLFIIRKPNAMYTIETSFLSSEGTSEQRPTCIFSELDASVTIQNNIIANLNAILYTLIDY